MEPQEIYKITTLPGDGIGPEIMKEAIKVLGKISESSAVKFEFTEAVFGGKAIDETGEPLPQATLDQCLASDAVLLAAIGGPKWDTTDPEKPRPEQGLLGIRKGLGLYANLRPVKIWSALKNASTLKEEIIDGVDLIVVRELTGGIYFGKRGRQGDLSFDTCEYQTFEIDRIAKAAFKIASNRGKLVHSVDKANVLETSRHWRQTVMNVAQEFPEVTLEHMLVDNAAMQLVVRPKAFDVILTENLFGDILSDEAAVLTGSLGMLSSASIGEHHPYLYEPSHGSAPDIAGQNKANPLAMILSAALMLRMSFEMEAEATAIESAIEDVLNEGYRTADIFSKDTDDAEKLMSTDKMGDLVAAKL